MADDSDYEDANPPPAANPPVIQIGGGGGQAQGAGAGAAAVPAAGIIILLSPWDGEIDLSTKTGKSLWNEGITPLETKFSGQGRDLVRFLASVKNRVDKCRWNDILIINGKDLLTRYGEITIVEVRQARDIRNAAPVNTLADARPKINAAMMYQFLYESLGPAPQKKLSTSSEAMGQDGPLLLKHVLDNTYVATQAATFSIKEKFYDLNLKNYKWNVLLMNQDVREKLIDLIAAGHASDRTDITISLFRGYNTAKNDEFLSSVLYWKNEWNNSAWTDPEDLMRKADAKYVELRDLGTWGKRSAKDEQIVALTAQLNEKKKTESQGNQGNKGKDKSDNNAKKQWKYDKSLSSSNSLTRNDKTFKWCTGPGHGGVGMWVVHEPGKCTASKPNENKSGNGKPANKNQFDKQAFTTFLKAKDKDISDEEIQGKIEAITAVIES
jgi:hypothetical protein